MDDSEFVQRWWLALYVYKNLVNPDTRRSILKDGSTYKRLHKRYSDLIRPDKLYWESPYGKSERYLNLWINVPEVNDQLRASYRGFLSDRRIGEKHTIRRIPRSISIMEDGRQLQHFRVGMQPLEVLYSLPLINNWPLSVQAINKIIWEYYNPSCICYNILMIEAHYYGLTDMDHKILEAVYSGDCTQNPVFTVKDGRVIIKC